MKYEITISQRSTSWIAVHGRYYITRFFHRYAPATTSVLLNFCPLYFVIFVLYTLFLIFTSYNFCISIKLPPPLLSRHKILLFKHFLFYFYRVYIFYTITDFDFYYCYHYLYYCYCHQYFFNFNAFNFYRSTFYNCVLYLCINQTFLNFKHMKLPNIVQSWH